MSQSFVLSNLAARPARTIASLVGIALGVVLVMVTVGLARGELSDTGRRQKNVGAEIIFQSPGSLGASVSATPLVVPLAYCDRLRMIEGVRAVTPVGRYIRGGASGIGFELIEGIADQAQDGYVSYAEVSGIRIVEGHPLTSDDDVLVDRHYATSRKVGPGSRIELFNHTFRIAGIYEPESGARVKMRLSKMQELLAAPGKCSSILIKCQNPDEQEAVARRIDEMLPGNQIVFTRDIPSYYEKGVPSLNVFLRVVIGLALVVSSLVILLAMYTSITERTREIGILKSLGASRRFIVLTIEKEALTISLLGIVTGYIAAYLTKIGITTYTTLIVTFELKWMLAAAGIGLLAGMLGALYPALHAARQDPVKALAYE